VRRGVGLAAIIAVIVVSGLLLVLGIALTVLSFGFSSGIQSSSAVISGPGAAILSDVVGARRSIPGAQVVLRVESNSGTPVFVGVAEPEAVDRFLSGVAYDVVPRLDVSTNATNLRSVPGTSNAASPRSTSIWITSAQGTSPRLVWNLDDTGRALVFMNADGSGGVSVRVVTLVSIASTGWKITSIALVGLGALLLVVSVIALRRVRRGPPATPQHAATSRRWGRRRGPGPDAGAPGPVAPTTTTTSENGQPGGDEAIEVSGVDSE